MKNYVNLNVRSNYSFLTSTISFERYFAFAKKHNLQVLALTDINVMYGAYEFYQKCVSNNIKPLLGIDCQWKNDDILIDIVIFCRSFAGYQSLLVISTFLNCNQAYLTNAFLKQDAINKNDLIFIIKTRALTLMQLQRNYQTLKSLLIFDVYLGVDKTNDADLSLYQQITPLLVPLHPVNYLTMNEASLQQVLQAIKQQKTLKAEQLVSSGDDYFYLERDFTATYAPVLLHNLNALVAQCHLQLPIVNDVLKINSLPPFPCPADVSSSQYLRDLCQQQLHTLFQHDDNHLIRYQQRLDYELMIIEQMQFNDYFLIVHDYVQFAKTNNILVGPGRGSAAGSLVAYLLKITAIDPLVHDLLFERFLNQQRQTFPDIDLDFEDERREEIFQYLVKKYGKEHVARIVTFQTIASKMALRDLARVLMISLAEVNEMTKLITSERASDLLNAPKLAIYRQKYPLLFIFAQKIIGFPRQTGTHASGIVLTKKPLLHYIPLQKSFNNIDQSQYAMNNLMTIGLIKMDILGLRTLTMIKHICQNIKQHYHYDLALNLVELNDDKTFALLKKGNTSGIFQLESTGMQEVVMAMETNSFADIVAAISLFRPGPQEYITTYINCKLKKTPPLYCHNDLIPILASTYGIIIYQEQIMLILQKIAGFSLAKADIIRAAISKKNHQEMQLEAKNFINSAIKNGYSQDVATKIWYDIAQFAGYGFNKAHAVAYALISYWLAYLKANYTIIFMSCLLTSAIGNDSKLWQYITECHKYQIKVLAPSINHSEIAFIVAKTNNAIIYSLQAIKQMSYHSCNNLVQERNRNGVFSTFFNFCARAVFIHLSRRQIEYLIAAGATDEFNYNRTTLLANLDNALKYANIVQSKNNDKLNFLFAEPTMIIYQDNWENNSNNEIQALGLSLKFNREQKWKQALDPDNKTVSLNLLANYIAKTVIVYGKISAIKVIKTKTEQLMAFVTLQSDNTSVAVTIFARSYALYQTYLQVNAVLSLVAKVNKYEDKINLILLKIIQVYHEEATAT